MQVGSGDVGFVAARVVASEGDGGVTMGLVVQDVSLTSPLGYSVGAFAWWPNGFIHNRFTTPLTDGSVSRVVKSQAGFGVEV